MRRAKVKDANIRIKKKSKLPYVLLVHAIVLLVMFTFYPFLRSIWLSFFVTDNLGNPGRFVGLSNYKRVLASNEFWGSISITLRYGGLIGLGTFTLAMILAFICVNQAHGSKIYTTMFALPMALASAPVAAMFLYIFGRFGLVNNLFGTTNSWITDDSTALMTMVIIVMWANCGSSFIYLLVGLRNVPDDLIECADLDGATHFTKFFRIYLPIASPQVFFVVFLNIVGAFKSFAMIKILLGNTNSTMNVLIFQVYKYAFLRGRFETGCVYAIVLCLVIFLTTRIQFLFEKKLVFYK
jgi:sn-glycerol 3-phosphate transport system permease protein